MAILRRAIVLLALTLATVLGLSAFTSSALAYPPGTKATVTTSSSRVDPGGTITISGSDYRTSARVVIKVVCRSSSPTKKYTATYRTKASGGSFSEDITIGSEFPNGRCKITASTGKQAENSDSATFFVNTPSHRGDTSKAVRLAGLSTGVPPVAGSGSGWGAVLAGGLALTFLISGGALLVTGRRKHAIVRG